METLEITALVSNSLWVLVGVYSVAIILRVYSLYRSLGFSKTVMTPFLAMGVFFAFGGITEFMAFFAVEIGLPLHSLSMVLVAALFMYGLREYHKMLMSAEKSKEASKLSFSKS